MLSCATLRSLQGFIPTGSGLCITALLPAFRMSLKKYFTQALLLSLGNKLLPKLCGTQLLSILTVCCATVYLCFYLRS